MEKKLHRVFRERPLTLEESAADRVIREEVMAEFPPKVAPSPTQPSSLCDLLKQAIRDSQKSVDVLAGETGVSRALISQFLSGRRDIRITTAD